MISAICLPLGKFFDPGEHVQDEWFYFLVDLAKVGLARLFLRLSVRSCILRRRFPAFSITRGSYSASPGIHESVIGVMPDPPQRVASFPHERPKYGWLKGHG